MEEETVEILSRAYDSNADKTLLRWSSMTLCDTRRALDAAVCAALGIDAEDIATIPPQSSRRTVGYGADGTESDCPRLRHTHRPRTG